MPLCMLKTYSPKDHLLFKGVGFKSMPHSSLLCHKFLHNVQIVQQRWSMVPSSARKCLHLTVFFHWWWMLSCRNYRWILHLIVSESINMLSTFLPLIMPNFLPHCLTNSKEHLEHTNLSDIPTFSYTHSVPHLCLLPLCPLFLCNSLCLQNPSRLMQVSLFRQKWPALL